MKTGRVLGAALVALSLGAGSAMAAGDACTEEMLEERQAALMAFMSENPDKAEAVMGLIEEVEKDYGGEPPEDKQCEAMDRLLEGAKAL